MNLVCEVTCVGLNGKERGSEAEIKRGPTRGSFLDDEVGKSLFWCENREKTREKEESNLQIM